MLVTVLNKKNRLTFLALIFFMLFGFSIAQEIELNCNKNLVFTLKPNEEQSFQCVLHNNSDKNYSLTYDYFPREMKSYLVLEEIPTQLGSNTDLNSNILLNFTILEGLLPADLAGYFKINAIAGSNPAVSMNENITLLTSNSYAIYLETYQSKNPLSASAPVGSSPSILEQSNSWLNNRITFGKLNFENWVLIPLFFLIVAIVAGVITLSKKGIG